jgi:hypothetical protein
MAIALRFARPCPLLIGTVALVLLISHACAAQSLRNELSVPGPLVSTQPACEVTPFSQDGYTALLDHFNGSTVGTVTGNVSYGPSVSGLGRALQFSKGSWLEYQLRGWYEWSSDYAPDGKAGAIELFIKPSVTRVAGDFLTINWNSSSTAPSAGYITHLGLDSSGRLTFGGWTSITNNPFDTVFSPPHTIIPAHTWTHIAYVWGPGGTAVYVNGSLEATSSLDYYPALNSAVSVYLNAWGTNVLAAVDELRISTIARASLMSCAE